MREQIQDSSGRNWWPSVVFVLVAAIFVWVFASIESLLGLMFSPMLFDAPGSEDNGFIWVMIGGLIGVPGLSLVSVPACIIALFREVRTPDTRKIAWSFAALPMAALIVCAIGWVAVDVVCGGSLSCR